LNFEQDDIALKDRKEIVGNCCLMQKEVRLQGKKGLQKGAEPAFPFETGL